MLFRSDEDAPPAIVPETMEQEPVLEPEQPAPEPEQPVPEIHQEES